jgi:hypothetical protein
MRLKLRVALAATGCAVALSVEAAKVAQATSITVSDPFLEYYNAGPNDLGFATGAEIRFGATSVVPNGGGGTTGSASTFNAATGATITNTIPWITSPVSPNQFTRTIQLCTTACTATGNDNPANLLNPG